MKIAIAFALMLVYWGGLRWLRRFLLNSSFLFLGVMLLAGCSYSRQHAITVSVKTITIDLMVKYDTCVSQTSCESFATER